MAQSETICLWNSNKYVPFPDTLLITGFVTEVTRQMPHVEQKLPTDPEHLSLPPFCNGVRFARSLVFCVVVLCRSLLNNNCDNSFNVTLPYLIVSMLFHICKVKHYFLKHILPF
jgi:hypothetical protein